MFLNLVALLTAISISAVAAYYSIVGLTAVFSGAFWPIVIMGSALEIGKIVATVWLHTYWNDIKLFLKGLGYKIKQVKLGLESKLVNGKVELSATLTKAELAGIQVILQYDNTKLTLDQVVFDAGSTVTNFSTNKDNKITFGSIDQVKTGRIKAGTPYKLIFTPKETLTNTAGLFYTVLADAVDAKGNKINLIVE
jgi:hypothetical protein